MAEAIARHYFGKSIYVQSAGVRKGEANGFMASTLAEIGIDGSKHKPRTLEELEEWEGLNFDLIISLSPEAHHAALELTRTIAAEVEYWPTPDPTITQGSREQVLDAYRNVRDGLMYRIRLRLKQGSHPRALMTARVPRPARRPTMSIRVTRHGDDGGRERRRWPASPLSIATGRIVARMMEPGSARRPRSMRGVMRTRLMTHDACDAAQKRHERHGGDGENRAPRARDDGAERVHSISIPAATPASAPAMMKT